MLARAARRKLRRDAFRSPTQLAEQLALPWQRPAQLRWTASIASATPTTTTTTTNAHDARRPRQATLSPRLETRSLATQADAQPSHIPFDGLIQPFDSHAARSPRLSRLESWDPASPLILRDAVDPPTVASRYGIGGDPIELYQNLHACLRVGRMQRAEAIIQRLVALYNPTASELVEAHNGYLRTMLEMAQQNSELYTMATIEEWYASNMVRNAIEPNASTFITLLRASMTLLDGEKRQQSLRKYLALAEQCCGSDVMEDINYSEDFDDDEWDMLIRAQPERFKEPEAMEVPNTAEAFSISTPLGVQTLIDHGIIANPSHAVKAIPQKGEGLKSLKNALAIFDQASRVPYPHDMEGSKEDKDRAYAYMRQIQIERDSMDSALNRWKIEDEKLQKMGIHGVLKSKPVQALMWQWYLALVPLIKDEVARTQRVLTTPSKDNDKDERHSYGPYLELCKPEKLAAITISRILRSVAIGHGETAKDLKVAVLSIAIADDIRNEAYADAQLKAKSQQKKQRKKARRAMLDTLSLQPQDNKTSANPTQDSKGKSVEPPLDTFLETEIPKPIKAKLGAMLIQFCLQAATVTVTAEDPKTGNTLTSTQPAFYHRIGYANGKKTGWIVAHDEILRKLCKEPTANGVHALQLPMVFEPKPWTSFNEGGYYTSTHGVVRLKNGDHSQRAYAESAIANGDMEKMLAGLDVLSKVPWKINKSVFEVMVQAWNAGESIGAMVGEHDDAVAPEEPSADAPPDERRQWAKAIKEYEDRKSGLHSQRSYQNYQLETARAFVNEERLYFPHSVDFRGRAYPISPILNHMGSDFSRCLLVFANGKELGSVGLQWLKVHLANLYGYDKASLREREQFTMDNLHEIYDSATNPLGGRRWWTNADAKWQCLACCMELKNALESPDPTRFISHLPIHQDGTCNGLQHYAALGGDHAGASQVNLEPSDRPQDIYTGVADLVRGMVEEDAAKGKRLAILLKDKITRKVVKRTVMTNVYGVTFIGAKDQVLDEIKGTYQVEDEETEVWNAALYIAKKIFDALGKIFNGAQEIQYWLGECGERILTSLSREQIKRLRDHLDGKGVDFENAKYRRRTATSTVEKKLIKDLESFKTPIIWTTPLKMPVVQPYRKSSTTAIRTRLQDITISTTKPAAIVDKRKQLQAFPPNFIHSLDATHMVLSALKCTEMGLDFAAVHDSFWTHAADIPNLNVILRDAFVRMHSEDIMGRLLAEFNARYDGSMYRASLKRHSVVGKKISAWRLAQVKALSSTKRIYKAQKWALVKDARYEELVLELKRQELLNSEDPKEKEEGRQMVTPTSIWLANQDISAFSSRRLELLGESKRTAGGTADKAKTKILEAEAEQTKNELEAAGKAPRDITDEEIAAAEADLADATEEWEDEDGEMEAAGSSKRNWGVKTVTVWLPLVFPPVPTKGGWDVTRLRESKYFFS
ncbi:hypothetical protein GRF29_154g1051899 [Pseudopithomyces chartarum]|uniref:DNA-directed RNA polymerase n=1 Tax=Pseudopithomyces chartarum TaxID=1892770 RepID=A0AAN6LRF9_9PLEO|nr:hypothetical protein GRF29_154g1051899 [Pseudopithomyces chartarum]